jgi:SpoIVB peptidase S55
VTLFRLLLLGLGCVVAGGGIQAAEIPLFELSELRPGMRGMTRTVMQGTTIESIETEVLGVAKNALGPGKDLIIGKLIDPRTALTGAVHGMSGSPLYIDGKMVGALSRRIAAFEKDGHCGFTPIQDMLGVASSPRSSPMTAKWWPGVRQMAAGDPTTLGKFSERMEFLGVPLTVSGLTEKAMGQLLQWSGLQDQGWMVMAGGGSGAKKEGLGPEVLQPGSAVSAVLMTGDLAVAGTGTLTWREGNKVLGFGHPMLGVGQATWPMGTAEIITVVPSYMRPFKMANQSRIVGTITQDRLSAIYGEVGTLPVLAKYRVEREHEKKVLPVLQGELVSNRMVTPMLIGAALAGPLLNRDELNQEFSLEVQGVVKFRDLPDLTIAGRYGGEMANLMEAVFDLIRPVAVVFEQDWSTPEVTEVQLKLITREQAQVWDIEGARLLTPEVEAGNKVRCDVFLKERYGQRRTETVEMALPEGIKGGSVEVRISAAQNLDEASFFRGLRAVRNTGELIERLNQRRARDAYYVQLISGAQGEVIHQYELPALPPSVRVVMEAGNQTEGRVALAERVWAETKRPVDGVVHGSARGRFNVR